MRNFFPTIILAITMLFIFPAGPASAAYPAPTGNNIAGDRQVYMAWYEGSWEIFMHDIAGGEITRITDEPHTQGYPDVWGDYIVWQDNRDNPDPDLGGFSIYLYDINTQNTQKISPATGYSHQEPQITNGKVVWTGYDIGKREIHLYDIAGDSTEVITSTLTNPTGLKFDGQTAAWIDFRNGGNDLYVYNSGREKQVSSGQDINFLLAVDNGRVAYAQKDNGYYQVKLYNPATGATETLTSGAGDHLPVAMSGNNLLVSSDSGLALWDTATGNHTSLDLGNVNLDQLLLQGNQIITIKGVNITKQPLPSMPTGSTNKNATLAELQTLAPAEVLIKPSAFTDLNGHWCAGEVQVLVAHGIVNGFSDNTFRPEQKITRAEFVSLLANCDRASIQAQDSQGFADVPAGHWAAAAIETARRNGWVGGYPGNKFMPGKTITREEMTAMLIRYSGAETEPGAGHLAGFTDRNDISPWAEDALNTAVSMGLISGYNNRLNPGAETTRAEACVILYRLLEQQKRI